MPKANRVFSPEEIRRKGIVVTHLHRFLFHGNKLIALPKRNPSFFICRVHARKTARFARHQVVIFFTLFTVGGFQTGAVGEDPQCRISGIGQRAVGVLKVVVHLAGGHYQNGAYAGGSSGHCAAVGIIALGITEGLIEPDNAVVALFFIRWAFIEEADHFAGLGG